MSLHGVHPGVCPAAGRHDRACRFLDRRTAPFRLPEGTWRNRRVGSSELATSEWKNACAPILLFAENAGKTACATTADQCFAGKVGHTFSLPGVLPRAARLFSGTIGLSDAGPA